MPEGLFTAARRDLASMRCDRLLIALLAADAILVAVNLALGALKTLTVIEAVPWAWNLATELNIGAIFTFGKWIVLAALCALAAWRRPGLPALVPAALAAIFVLLFADDAFQGHERLGRALVARFDLPAPPHLRAQDLGELTVAAGMGALLLLGLSAAWAVADRADRVRLVGFAGLFALLALFGVALDMLHVALDGWGMMGGLCGVIEDGGEMAAASLLIGYVRVAFRPELAPRAAARRFT